MFIVLKWSILEKSLKFASDTCVGTLETTEYYGYYLAPATTISKFLVVSCTRLNNLKLLMCTIDVGVSSLSPWCRSLATSSSSNLDAQKQYFWLYNVQSKGPKCQRATGRFFSAASDPHILSRFHDPVTDVRSRTSVKHSQRQRDRSDVDTDANPRRLLQIGNELQRLTAIINAPPSTLADFSLSPREKNKYASKICRLKRKAQHEANKIKLQGLEEEHRK